MIVTALPQQGARSYADALPAVAAALPALLLAACQLPLCCFDCLSVLHCQHTLTVAVAVTVAVTVAGRQLLPLTAELAGWWALRQREAHWLMQLNAHALLQAHWRLLPLLQAHWRLHVLV